MSDHFDGRRFVNPGAPGPLGFRDFLRWRRTSSPGPWPEWVSVPPGRAPERRVDDLRITHVNHSTVLIQMNGVNVLTDPVWSERVSPVGWAGPRRHRAPGIRFEDLPPIDVVLISHNHYDHLDVPTLSRLAAEHRPRVVVPLGLQGMVTAAGLRQVTELDWWGTAPVGAAMKITSVPARHFSGRGLRDRDRTLWCGFVIEGPAGAVYFAGDTGWGKHFSEIRTRLGAMRLALLPVGAFLPRWFMGPVHLSPDEAVRAHRVLEAGISVGIHYGTFNLADDGYSEPASALDRALDGDGRARFWMVPFGEGRDVPPHTASAQNT